MLCFPEGQTYKCDYIGARENVEKEQTEEFRELYQAFSSRPCLAQSVCFFLLNCCDS